MMPTASAGGQTAFGRGCSGRPTTRPMMTAMPRLPALPSARSTSAFRATTVCTMRSALCGCPAPWRTTLTGDADARRRGLHAAQLRPGGQPGGVHPRVERHPRLRLRHPRLGDHRLPVQHSAFVLGERGNQGPALQKIAMTHADTVAANFIRADGSVRHIVEFDPETGAFVRDYGGRAMRRAPAGRAGRPGRCTAL